MARAQCTRMEISAGEFEQLMGHLRSGAQDPIASAALNDFCMSEGGGAILLINSPDSTSHYPAFYLVPGHPVLNQFVCSSEKNVFADNAEEFKDHRGGGSLGAV